MKTVSYSRIPSEGETIGSLSIPTINRKLRIVQGTTDESLKQGVGHFTESVLPGQNDNCVLSGHRDSVFEKLGLLKIGDHLIVDTVAGKFNYEIKGIRIVDKDDKTVIVPRTRAVLTLTTCYPFTYFGYAPQRYIITANLSKSV
ncbi:MAG: class D sortase [Bacillota bacterium]